MPDVHRCIGFVAYEMPPSVIREFDDRFPFGVVDKRDFERWIGARGAPMVQYDARAPLSDLRRRMMRAAIDEVALLLPHEMRPRFYRSPKRTIVQLLLGHGSVADDPVERQANDFAQCAMILAAAALQSAATPVARQSPKSMTYALDALMFSGCARRTRLQQSAITAEQWRALRQAILYSLNVAVQRIRARDREMHPVRDA